MNTISLPPFRTLPVAERFALLALATGVVVFLLGDLMIGFDMRSALIDSALTQSLGLLLRDVGLALGFGGSIGAGVVSLRSRGINSLGVVLLSGGLALCAVLSVVASKAARAFESIGELVQPLPQAALQQLLETAESTKVTIADRVQASRLYAAERYKSDGVTVQVLREDGQVAPYQPTEADRRDRENALYVQRYCTAGGKAMRRVRIMWPLVGLASLVVAALVRASPRSPNERLQADAQEDAPG